MQSDLSSVGNVHKKLNELPEADRKAFKADLEDANFAKHLDEAIDPEALVDSWKALAEFPNLRKIPTNLEVLNKVKGKFAYNGKVGQEALEEVFTGHRSAQKFIDNFNKYDEIIGEVDNITITGIKSSSEVRILNNGSQVGKVVEGKINVNYIGFGSDIVCHSSKTTTGVGKYSPPGEVGTKSIIDSKLSKSGENPGGVNILSDSRNTQGWSSQKIWDEINQPWLDDAIARGDDIRAVSNPLNIKHVFANTEGIPTSVFSSSGALSNYLKNLSDLETIEKLSFYGREIRHLSQNNYLFDATSKTFMK